MGSTESRFREAVRTGNAEVAYDLYYLKNNVRNRVVPNSSLGPYYDENTLLHYAALHGMKRLYVDFIKMGGRPDQKVRTCTYLCMWAYTCTCVCVGRGEES